MHIPVNPSHRHCVMGSQVYAQIKPYQTVAFKHLLLILCGLYIHVSLVCAHIYV